MGLNHTKGRRVPPRNLRLLKVRKSCASCVLLDIINGPKLTFSCRRPDGPTYVNRFQSCKYVCNGHTTQDANSMFLDA